MHDTVTMHHQTKSALQFMQHSLQTQLNSKTNIIQALLPLTFQNDTSPVTVDTTPLSKGQ